MNDHEESVAKAAAKNAFEEITAALLSEALIFLLIFDVIGIFLIFTLIVKLINVLPFHNLMKLNKDNHNIFKKSK